MADAKTLVELLELRAAHTPDALAFVAPDESHTTFAEVADRTRALRASLAAHEVGKGTRVGILLPTSMAWEISHFAVLRAGGVVVGLDPRSDARSLEACLEAADVTAIVVDGMDRLAALQPRIRARLRVVVCTQGGGGNVGAWRLYVRGDDGALWPASTSLERATTPPEHTEHDALATVVFTSGSAGTPKALAYTHGQLLSAAHEIVRAFPGIGAGSTQVAWLPLASLFQRMVDVAAILVGATTHFVDDPRQAVARARVVSPRVFVAVPRFLQELRRAFVARPRWLERLVVRLTLAQARAVGRAQRTGGAPPLAARIARRLLRGPARRLRQVLGTRLEALVVGSAPLPVAISDELEGLGIPVLEAYGLSECVLPVAMNRLHDRKPGTVGRVLPGHELRIASDGELQIKSAALAASLGRELPLTHDGFLMTGDLGELDGDGRLVLHGRKATILKLSDGKKIDPVVIEQRLATIPWIDQVQVVGHGLARPGAIVWLGPAASRDERAMRAELKRAMQAFPRRERPSRYVFVPRPASIALGEITTTLKLRRAANAHRFASFFDDTSLNGSEDVRWLPATS